MSSNTFAVPDPPGLATFADALVASRRTEAEPEAAGLSLLGTVLAAPGAAVRSAVAGRAPGGWEVIARSGETLTVQPLSGDVMLRMVEGGAAHIAVVASPGLLHANEVAESGLHAESGEGGGYVHVIEPGPTLRSASEGFARRVTDSLGYLLTDLVLLRLAQPPGTAQPAPTVIVQGAPGLATPGDESEADGAPIDDARLSWPDASAEQLDLMRRVYRAQVSRASRTRSFVGDVAAADLAEIEHGIQARPAAAESCRRLLADVRAAAAADSGAASVSRIGLVSGYRSATSQLAIWNRNFPRYYAETRAARQARQGGEFGPAASDLLVAYISGRLAAPGFSLHNNGLAIDFITVQDSISMGADTSADNRSHWRGSWLFGWLAGNASRYGFFQNTSIDEPWHWEFRDSASAAQSVSADDVGSLFTPDTLEPTDVYPAAETAFAAGRAEFSNTPLLASHRGTQPDLILRWNDMSDPSALDVVVHLHGYSGDGLKMSLRNKERFSGLDFGNPDSPADTRPGRSSPTLCILPRGNYIGDQPSRNPAAYNFPSLTTPTGIQDLIAYGVGKFVASNGLPTTPSVRRLIMTAHSGGGAALNPALANNVPDEIQVFDALYGGAESAEPLIRWVRNRIALEMRSWTSGKTRAEGGLCIVYREGGTAANSLRVASEIARLIANAPSDARPVLQAAYRVLRTDVDHNHIPSRFGWLLLADIAQPLPSTFRTPAESRSIGEPPTPNSGDDSEADPDGNRTSPQQPSGAVSWRVAGSLLVLRDQINARAPTRSKASDGTIGDAAHAARDSDHNPWVKDGGTGVVTALDITHDPAGGCDAGTLADALVASLDARIKYLIWNRRIVSSSVVGGVAAWTWRKYAGASPHTEHIHISVSSDKALYDSQDAWSI